MIEQQWLAVADRFKEIRLHEYIVMPNHFHGIIEIIIVDTQNADKSVGVPLVGTLNDGQPQGIAEKGQPQGIAPTVGDVAGAYKSLSTNEYIRNVKQNNWHPFDKKLWQRNYYEHIIRDEKSYHKLSDYIVNNPLRWQEDKYYEQNSTTICGNPD